MHVTTLTFAFWLSAAAIVQAQSAPDLERDRAELLRMHAADRKAHFKTDAELLMAQSGDQMISVRDGAVRWVAKADRIRALKEYFRGARYQEWDNLEEPILRISRDGSMAWMITRLKVRRMQRDSSGEEAEQKFVYAGIMTYEKVDGRWIRVANVSTFEEADGR